MRDKGYRDMRMSSVLSLLIVCTVYGTVDASLVMLVNGTSTFTQESDDCTNCGPVQTTDGIYSDVPGPGNTNGWTIAAPPDRLDAFSQTIVWEAATDISAYGIQMTMYFNHWNPQHLLGRFRFSVTQDDRSTFADGLKTGGDVSATWTVLDNGNVSGPAGMNFTVLSDNSVLAGGDIPSYGTYVVQYSLPFDGVTGLRLEALDDPALPFSGPGFHATNGNFVLTEIEVETFAAVPEPSSAVIFVCGVFGYGCLRKFKFVGR